VPIQKPWVCAISSAGASIRLAGAPISPAQRCGGATIPFDRREIGHGPRLAVIRMLFGQIVAKVRTQQALLLPIFGHKSAGL